MAPDPPTTPAAAADREDPAPLPPRLRGLLRPEAYPHPVGEVRVVETHMSWVLLTGEFVYKLKRPVRFPFADFTDPAHRAHLCEEELRLNRRFAPSLYLGTAAVRLHAGLASFVGEGPVIETAVRMRQFDRGQELDALVAAGGVDAAALASFGAQLAAVHRTLPRPPAGTDHGEAAAVARVVRRNLVEFCAMHPPATRGRELADLRHRLAARLRHDREALARRAAAGRIRECHGDLHLSNLVRLGGRITPFDALEFEPAFRYIDVADEVAFVCADLQGYGRPDLAHAFLDGYLDDDGDFALLRVLGLYVAHRALVRAKIMALRAAAAAAAAAGVAPPAGIGNDDGNGASDRDGPTDAIRAAWQRREADYVAVATRSLAAPAPRLLLLYGLSGSGKSWLARRLAPRLGAIRLCSDRERKRLAGLAPAASSGSSPGAGLYCEDATESTYAHLARCTEQALAGGYSVICDATFLSRERRGAFAALAGATGATPLVLQCEAPPQVLRARLRARRAAGGEVSEADEAVLTWQLARAEPPDAAEGLVVHRIDTTAADPVELALLALSGG
jgi:aminoglycoside phosphotransferase family enzyme/predicted kinase